MSSGQWDWFCGENSTVEKENFLDSTCKVNASIVISQVIFAVGFPLILVVLQCCTSYGSLPSSKYLFRLPGHSSRWVVTFLLLVVSLAALAEGILTNDTFLKNTLPMQPYLFVPGAVMTIAVITSLVFYHWLETWRVKHMVWPLLLYWVASLLTSIFKMIHLERQGLIDVHVFVFDVALAAVVLFAVMLIEEIVLIRSIVFLGYDNPLYATSDSTTMKKDMKYLHDHCTILSAMTYWWANWIFTVGFKQAIEPSMLGSVPDCHTSEYNHKIFKENFLKEKVRADKAGQEINMYRIYWNTYGTRWVTGGVFKLCADFSVYVAPLCISGIILFVTDTLYGSDDETVDVTPYHVTASEFFSNGYVLVGCIFIAALVKGLLEQAYFYWNLMEGLHVRSAIQSMVYEKALRLSTYAMSGGMMTMGQITNHMSIDATNVQFFFNYGVEIFTIPVKIGMTLYLLYEQLGYPSLIGASVFILVIPFQLVLAWLTSKYIKEVLLRSDQRMKFSNEMLQGIKILKLYGWERLYCESVKDTRQDELSKLVNVFIIQAVNFVVNLGVPITVNLVSFSIYTAITGEVLSPDVAFSSLYLFNSLVDPMFVFPYVISLYVSSHISTKRVKFFLVAPEVEGREPQTAHHQDNNGSNKGNAEKQHIRQSYRDLRRSSMDGEVNGYTPSLLAENPAMKTYGAMDSSPKSSGSTLPEGVAIQISNGYFTWDPDSEEPVLHDINVDIPEGKLTVIVGTVGSGKSSILQAVLGEMTTLRGRIQIREGAKIALGQQKAWLVNCSLRDNVTFGEPYDSDRYREVIDACALTADIEMLPGGDNTEIGEKGLNLSGGQKQRVSVARTMYSGRDIIILDDPLSALDMHVGSHLFERGILKILKKRKQTIILVTHQLQYLPEADKILIMKDGRILHQGDPDDINQADPSIMAESQRALKVMTESEAELSGGESQATLEERRSLKKQISQLSASMKTADDKIDEDDERGKLVVKEDQETGSVSYEIYFFYLKAMNYVVGITAVLTVLAGCGFEIGTNFWLATWSEASLEANNTQDVLDDTNYYISIYAALSGCNVFFKIVSVLFLTAGVYYASKNLHFDMLDNIIKAPMRFFDTTPTGRVLNRFSSDTQLIDQRLIQNLRMFLNLGSMVLAVFAVIISVEVFFIFFIIPVGIVFFILAVYYVTTSRELQRCESVTRSPVFAHFSETLNGLPTIRSFGDQKRFFQTALDRILVNNRVYAYLIMSQRWIGFRLEWLGATVVLFSSLFCLLGAFYFGIEASYVGLAVTYSLEISLYMTLTVRAAAELELQMNAVERVKFYSDIEGEDYGGIEPPPSWPQKGEIQIENICVRYARDLDAVLNDVNITIPSQDKLGICGRTGSGKSSLTLALFRMIDTYQGRIVIDGIDISTVPLRALRQRLSIIPQDAFLFTGTIRSNLDPTNTKRDEELWKALEIAQLKDIVSGQEEGLDYQVTEGGDNFSVGQRQLFCLARAFLRNSQIVVMDEATASIDHETDRILQDVVADVFEDRTVLTIAHRVGTILNGDHILTLSDGHVIEYDTPNNLLDDEDSVFASLVRAGK
ncbi:ATP-binding cassette sub-family C member 9-like [Diadema setosum]|uniref:ATP-binding cassette sub-family C member 9-like n=1 Tax=Diadema setosum TaxID=31175 RepID=UPI003B3A8675